MELIIILGDAESIKRIAKSCHNSLLIEIIFKHKLWNTRHSYIFRRNNIKYFMLRSCLTYDSLDIAHDLVSQGRRTPLLSLCRDSRRQVTISHIAALFKRDYFQRAISAYDILTTYVINAIDIHM